MSFNSGAMLAYLRTTPSFFLQPIRVLRDYNLRNIRLDTIAGLTVAVVLLPQAIAYALIAELPPEVGLYTAIVAAVVGALAGSSYHLQTGPTNAISLLILSTLLTITTPSASEFLILAGLMAILAGVIQLILGLARLGVLVNFVSHSVIVGFSSGAGVLIAIKQMRHVLGLEFSSSDLIDTVHRVIAHLPETHGPTLSLGLGTILLIILLRRLNPKLPGPLIGMVSAAVIVGLLGLNQKNVTVIGQLPRSLPPLAKLPLLNLELISRLSTGALAVAAIGLVEAISIARSIATQTGQHLDSNQEFVGQGLANIASGLFSGYPCSGSFTRSAVNFRAGGQSPLASVFSGLFVLVSMLALAPLAVYVPRAALAGVLIVTAYGMIDFGEIARIWRGAHGDAAIMIVTFLGTLFLDLEFAVLAGILLSFAVYIVRSSVPKVTSVLPDDNFRYLTHQPGKPPCPQMGILDILGDLYFGAVGHIEEAVREHLTKHPGQRFLLLRMHSVDQCDYSGIHALESIVRACREQGGDVFFVRVQEPVSNFMRATDFSQSLGLSQFLAEEHAIDYLFHRILDPAVCIYECEVRVFKECQNLPKRAYPEGIPLCTGIPTEGVASVSCQSLWQQLRGESPPLLIDVREPREFWQGHIPQAQLIPLPKLLPDMRKVPRDHPVVFVCRSGRRSARAAYVFQNHGHKRVSVLRGGMLAWEAAGLLEALE